METLALLGSASGLGLVSGIRLYSTVLAVGLGIKFGWIELDPQLHRLEILANPYILSTAGFVYLVEFFADKIPLVDTLWDAVHTFIRPIGAALVGAAAFGEVDEVAGVLSLMLCGGIGLSGHSSKAVTRVLVNHSPEPFTNIGLSLFEDGLVIAGIWLALEHPILMLVLVGLFVAAFLLLLPKIIRLMKQVFSRLAAFVRS